ncbi:MAG: hypothetical protein IJ218_01255 [Alphaproteobacteria bacterium]|nr:hypothetical protein [Alphaproteobacteria bacterium]
MIIKEKSFKIKKIKETNENWLLYPKGEAQPLIVPKAKICAKLPPVWKFPWQCHTLNLKSVADYVIYAEMDGAVLRNIAEDNYPEHVKQRIAQIRQCEEAFKQEKREHIGSLKVLLEEYLPQVPEIKELEDNISELPVCWRMYLKMLLPMQYQNADSRQRLTLMYVLITIANRIYKRYVNTDEMFDINCAVVDFTLRHWTVFDLTDVLVEEIENKPKHQNSKAFDAYFEVRAELRRVLPQAPQRLEVYLVQTVCGLLETYAEDLALLNGKRSYTLLGESVSGDSAAYQWLRQEMKLPKISSLIVEKQFTDEDVANFNLSC